jgi:hypothetical protein
MFRALSAGERVAALVDMPRVRAILVSVLCVGAALAVPARASAATVDQIIALSKAGVSEPVILALIDRDKTIFPIEPEQLPMLKQQGLSDAIIMAMLKSGRDEGEAAARADSTANAARILASLSTAPEVLIVGHGPETPNTAHFGLGYYGGAFADVAPVVFPPVLPLYTLPIDNSRRSEVHRDRIGCSSYAPALPRYGVTPFYSSGDGCPTSFQLRPLRRFAR